MLKRFFFFCSFVLVFSNLNAIQWRFEGNLNSGFGISSYNVIADSNAYFVRRGLENALSRLKFTVNKSGNGYVLNMRLNSYEPPRNVELGSISNSNTDVMNYGAIKNDLNTNSIPLFSGLIDVFFPDWSLQTQAVSHKLYGIIPPTLGISLNITDSRGKSVYESSRIFNASSDLFPGKGSLRPNYLAVLGADLNNPVFSADVAISEMLLPLAFQTRGKNFFLRRDPRKAYYLSWLIPGSGKFYTNRIWSGLGDIIMESVLSSGAYFFFNSNDGRHSTNIIGGITFSLLELFYKLNEARNSYNSAIIYNYRAFFSDNKGLNSIF